MRSTSPTPICSTRKIPKTLLTLGQHKAPFGLESNNSDNYNMFMERGMFTNAFGNAGAERRIGVSAAYAPKETSTSPPACSATMKASADPAGAGHDTPDESWGVNGRATWEPVFDTGKIVHLGVSGYYRTAQKSGDIEDAVRFVRPAQHPRRQWQHRRQRGDLRRQVASLRRRRGGGRVRAADGRRGVWPAVGSTGPIFGNVNV